MEVQFRKLVAKHREMVYNASLRVLRNSADAQDATQAVFLILWQKGSNVKEASRLAGWLYRVAVNISKNMIKSKVARRMREEAVAVEMQDNKENGISSAVSDHLDEAIASLPEKIRTPLVLHYFEGYSHREIGNILRCPRGTVSPRINAGISMLRVRFGKTGTAISAAVLVHHLNSMSAEAAPTALSAALDTLAAKGTVNAVATKLAATAMKTARATKTGVAVKTAVAMKAGVAVKTKAVVVIASALIVTGTGAYIVKKTMAKTNTPPLIEIAPTATPNLITLPGRIKLSVRASDVDGNPLTYTWKKISGPGAVTFSTNGTTKSARSEAAFSTAGNYVLAAHVSDGYLKSTGSVRVIVNNPAPGGLVGHWKLDETTGKTAVDSAGEDNNGTLINSPAWTTDGKRGGALLFDGSGDYVSIQNAGLLDNTDKLTVAFWMRPDQLNPDVTPLISKHVNFGEGQAYSISLRENNLNVDIVNAKNQFRTRTAFQPNMWCHVAVVYDGALQPDQQLKAYINGAPDKTVRRTWRYGESNLNAPAPETNTTTPKSSSNLYIGTMNPGYGASFFKGVMDDVRVYSKALSSKEVEELVSLPDTVYEDAENGNTRGWVIYDADPAGASISNVYDADRQSRVIQFSGFDIENGYLLSKDDESPWQNTAQFNIKWSMKFSEQFMVYVDVITDTLAENSYHRYLQYDSKHETITGTKEYIHFRLDSSITDGQWHTVKRNLRADLESALPGVRILAVDHFLIRGNGMLDDITLSDK